MKLLLNRVISKIDRSFNDDHKSIQIDDILKKKCPIDNAVCFMSIENNIATEYDFDSKLVGTNIFISIYGYI